MYNTETIGLFKQRLVDFQEDITEAISLELLRIARPVAIDEFSFSPFEAEVAAYIDLIYLKNDQAIMLKCSFADLDSKSLSECIDQEEINSWGLISLLDLLMNV